MVHRSDIDRSQSKFALQMVRDQIGRRVYPVHRLDRPTSGILIFCLQSESAHKLAERFKDGGIRKTYLAVVRGFTEKAGLIDQALSRTVYTTRKPKITVPALTEFRTLQTIELPFPVGPYPTCRYALVTAHPITGRAHQIRRHFRDISHPVVGDTMYGDAKHNRFFKEKIGCRRMLLAAMQLEFTHPYTGEKTKISARMDKSFAAVINRFGWQHALPDRWLS